MTIWVKSLFLLKFSFYMNFIFPPLMTLWTSQVCTKPDDHVISLKTELSKLPQATQTKWKGLTRILMFIGKQWLPLSKASSVRCTADWIWQISHSFSGIRPRSADRVTYRNRGPDMRRWKRNDIWNKLYNSNKKEEDKK